MWKSMHPERDAGVLRTISRDDRLAKHLHATRIKQSTSLATKAQVPVSDRCLQTCDSYRF